MPSAPKLRSKRKQAEGRDEDEFPDGSEQNDRPRRKAKTRVAKAQAPLCRPIMSRGNLAHMPTRNGTSVAVAENASDPSTAANIVADGSGNMAAHPEKPKRGPGRPPKQRPPVKPGVLKTPRNLGEGTASPSSRTEVRNHVRSRSPANEHRDVRDDIESTCEYIGRLEGMIDTMNRVGYTVHKNEKRPSADISKRPTQPRGKNLDKLLGKLFTEFGHMQEAEPPANGDDDTREDGTEMEQLIDTVFTSVKESTKDIVEDLNKLKEGDTSRRPLLLDLYFHVIPSFLATSKECAKVLSVGAPVQTQSLRRFVDLLSCLYDISTSASRIPPDCQPKPKGSMSYELILPNRRIIKDLKSLISNVEVELAKRECMLRAENDMEKMDRYKRNQEQREQKEAEERAREKKRRDKLRRRQFAKLREDPWISKHLSGAKGGRRMERTPQASLDEDDPFAENLSQIFARPPLERLQVDIKRTKLQTGPEPWSEKELEVFIDCMRDYEDDARYIKCSRKLKKSLAEIHAQAREMQQMFNHAHTVGNFDGSGPVRYDERWTHVVWVEQKESSSDER